MRPHVGSSGAITAQIERVDLPSPTITIEVTASAPARVVAARVVAADDPAPCSGGVAPIAIEGAETPSGWRGALRFPKEPTWTLLEGETALGVAVQTARDAEPACVVVPITRDDPSARFERPSDSGFSAGEVIRFAAPLEAGRGTRAQASVGARLARWIGPLAIGAELGVGASTCFDCGHDALFTVPAALGVAAFPLRLRRFALGVDASWELRPTFRQSDPSYQTVHGPRVSLDLRSTAPSLLGFPRGVELGGVGLSLSYARWLGLGSPSASGADVLGVAITFDTRL